MELSIVIPVLNESGKIGEDIEAAAEFLESEKLAGEIIVVDDGSTDNTAEVARNTQIASTVNLSVIRSEENRGKGWSVRAGVLESKGGFVMFADSGSCVPYKNALRGLRLLRDGQCDIAHASRKLVESSIERYQSWYRRVCSGIFRFVIICLMGISKELTDSQCGFKIYRGDVARELYSSCIIEGFMFDVEIILRAQKCGYKIKEFPIEWTCDRDSRLSVMYNSRIMLSELMTIKKGLKKEFGKPGERK